MPLKLRPEGYILHTTDDDILNNSEDAIIRELRQDNWLNRVKENTLASQQSAEPWWIDHNRNSLFFFGNPYGGKHVSAMQPPEISRARRKTFKNVTFLSGDIEKANLTRKFYHQGLLAALLVIPFSFINKFNECGLLVIQREAFSNIYSENNHNYCECFMKHSIKFIKETSDSIPLPGTIGVKYQLTSNGFKLVQIATSNSIFWDILAGNEQLNLTAAREKEYNDANQALAKSLSNERYNLGLRTKIKLLLEKLDIQFIYNSLEQETANIKPVSKSQTPFDIEKEFAQAKQTTKLEKLIEMLDDCREIIENDSTIDIKKFVENIYDVIGEEKSKSIVNNIAAILAHLTKTRKKAFKKAKNAFITLINNQFDNKHELQESVQSLLDQLLDKSSVQDLTDADVVPVSSESDMPSNPDYDTELARYKETIKLEKFINILNSIRKIIENISVVAIENFKKYIISLVDIDNDTDWFYSILDKIIVIVSTLIEENKKDNDAHHNALIKLLDDVQELLEKEKRSNLVSSTFSTTEASHPLEATPVVEETDENVNNNATTAMIPPHVIAPPVIEGKSTLNRKKVVGGIGMALAGLVIILGGIGATILTGGVASIINALTIPCGVALFISVVTSVPCGGIGFIAGGFSLMGGELANKYFPQNIHRLSSNKATISNNKGDTGKVLPSPQQ